MSEHHDIDVYRIKPTSDRLRRTWQAEWSRCQWAPRAWTERGIWRKARRWQLWHRDKSRLRPTVTAWFSTRHDDA